MPYEAKPATPQLNCAQSVAPRSGAVKATILIAGDGSTLKVTALATPQPQHLIGNIQRHPAVAPQSEILVVKITDWYTSDLWFVRKCSIIEAEFEVHLVGFVINCKKPKENNKSIYSVTCLIISYLSTSKLESPNRYTGTLPSEKSFKIFEKSSKNCENCSLDERVG
jgi:hypothetical protein